MESLKFPFNINSIVKELIIFIITVSVGLFFLTYVFKLPIFITGESDIVNDYYVKNFTKNIPLDFLFIFLYFLLPKIFIKLLKIENKLTRISIICLVTALLTGYFCYYFKNLPLEDDSNFFKIWFDKVGYTSVIYDVILLGFIYYLELWLKEKLSNEIL